MGEEWSEWLDFDRQTLESVPESAGAFVMHASMKVLYIGSSDNIRGALQDRLTDDCCSKSKRFKYMLAPSHEAARTTLLDDFAAKHQGQLPPCNGSK